MKHSSLLDDQECLRLIVSQRLREMGVKNCSLKSLQHKTKRAFPVTPGKTPQKRIFQKSLRDQSKVFVQINNEEILVPKFLVTICEYIRQHLEVEGIFRKAGSSARQKTLRVEIEASENFSAADEQVSVLDVASLLKQWLREIPEGLIPTQYHDLFLSCCTLNEGNQEEAVLNACCLLPQSSAATLTFLAKFFSDVASASDKNKMDVRNLAIVLTPSIFPVDEMASKKVIDSTNNLLSMKTKIVELIISNAEKVCFLNELLEETYNQAMNLPAFTSHSEDNLDDEAGVGPSARRRKKKKRRSGSLSRVLSATMKGIQKAISRSATPAGRVINDSVHSTPLPLFGDTPEFASPRLPVKGKATEADVSPNSKQRKPGPLESTFTPKVRSRSFSVKRFKRKKSMNRLKEATLVIHSSENQLINFSPLPSKPTFAIPTIKTPGTPDIGIQSGTDLSSGEKLDDDSTVNETDDDERSRGAERRRSRSATRRPGSANSRTGRRPSDRKPRSPSQRKIGIVRRRSQEAARRESLKSPHLTSVKLKIQDSSPAPRQRRLSRRDTLDAALAKKNSSPPKLVMTKVTPSKHDSLTNLKSEIIHMIEHSFGEPPKDASIQDGNKTDQNSFQLDNITSKMKEVGVNSPVTRSQTMRRQSSAFEFLRNPLGPREFRRQSSVFEMSKRPVPPQQNPPLYENISRNYPNRSSLRRKNSSVKDLISKLESTFKPPTVPPPVTKRNTSTTSSTRSRNESNGSKTSVPESIENLAQDLPVPPVFEDEWTDASEFFNNRLKECVETPGCKRSSIIRIRNENRGKVSQLGATFTKPLDATGRRQSARMGTAAAAGGRYPTTPSNKRQTLTGIRTTTQTLVDSKRLHQSARKAPSTNAYRRDVTPKMDKTPRRHIYQNIDVKPAATPTSRIPIYENAEVKRTPRRADSTVTPRNIRRSKRIEERRHLTIGYEGEVRSPLRETQNVLQATVKRSQSAQTPLGKKPMQKRRSIDTENMDVGRMVKRAHSLRSPDPIVEVPPCLKETIYDVTTPKSMKVRRYPSDRVVFSRKEDMLPVIKSSLNAGTPRKTPHKTPHKLQIQVPYGRNTPLRPLTTTPKPTNSFRNLHA